MDYTCFNVGFWRYPQKKGGIMEVTKLKLCPFCGKKPIGPEESDYDGFTEWWIECESCEIVMDRFSKSELIKAWNGRV